MRCIGIGKPYFVLGLPEVNKSTCYRMTDKILRGFMKVYKLSMSIRSATFTQPFIGNLIFRKRHIRRMTTLATGINLINIPWITRARCEDGITV